MERPPTTAGSTRPAEEFGGASGDRPGATDTPRRDEVFARDRPAPGSLPGFEVPTVAFPYKEVGPPTEGFSIRSRKDTSARRDEPLFVTPGASRPFYDPAPALPAMPPLTRGAPPPADSAASPWAPPRASGTGSAGGAGARPPFVGDPGFAPGPGPNSARALQPQSPAAQPGTFRPMTAEEKAQTR
jgi:hypothetical protein